MPHLSDHQGRLIRLTDERMAHILTHPELVGMEVALSETLASPDSVVQSPGDLEVRLYYRRYSETQVGNKLLCVVVKTREDDAFIITAYLTDRMKRGAVLWQKDE